MARCCITCPDGKGGTEESIAKIVELETTDGKPKATQYCVIA